MTESFSHPLFIQSEAELHSVKSILESTEEEFCFSINFDPQFISAICYLGLFPMAAEVGGYIILLIKLHEERCILDFENLHIPRNVKKRSGRYSFSVDHAFEECISAINEQHPNSWIFPPLAKAFIQMFYTKEFSTRLHSFELWEGDELVAGEVGFVVGAAYASLSGFFRKSSTGTIQLCATAKMLEQCGFAYWDLGMEIPYKLELGARSLDRELFLTRQRAIRDEKRRLLCQRVNAGEIIRTA
ncbi:MAG: hypothetical protein HQM13_04080 [SAR324 cluster bacterium]|nr:hypothetical protein [SAR324 cluster bacterium]